MVYEIKKLIDYILNNNLNIDKHRCTRGTNEIK